MKSIEDKISKKLTELYKEQIELSRKEQLLGKLNIKIIFQSILNMLKQMVTIIALILYFFIKVEKED